MSQKKINMGLMLFAALVLVVTIWGPEKMALQQDKASLNRIEVEPIKDEKEGYRYTLNDNEKIYILSKCLNSHKLPESELNAMTRVESEYEELTGTYAFVIKHQGPSEKEITNNEIYDICNQQLSILKEEGILPDAIKEVTANQYHAVLYSAIDVLEPRNNLSVWKVSLSTTQLNADKSNRLLDAYMDADTGKMYEFYVRTSQTWEDINPDEIIETWSSYMELEDRTECEDVNPLQENTPYFKKYRFAGMNEQNTVVTVGFYEGINELFLKISY